MQIQLNNFQNAPTKTTHFLKPVKLNLNHKNDSISFKSNENGLKQQLEQLKQKMLSSETPVPAVLKQAEKLGETTSKTLWMDYRGATFMYKDALPNVCFISLVDNIVNSITRKDTFFEKIVLKNLNKRSAGKSNVVDNVLDNILKTFGVKNEKAYIMDISKFVATEASSEQKEMFKLTLELNKDKFLASTSSKQLRILYDNLIKTLNN